MKQIQTRSQRNGGKVYFYPANELAVELCQLMKRKTFVPGDLELLKRLNYCMFDLSTGKEVIPCGSQDALPT